MLEYISQEVGGKKTILSDPLPVSLKNKLLTIIVNPVLSLSKQNVSFEYTTDQLRLFACALVAMIPMISESMSSVNEANMIVSAVSTLATSDPSLHLRRIGFLGMQYIVEFYYDKLPKYIQAFFQITGPLLSSADPSLDDQDIIEAIEVWTVLAET